MEIKIDERNTSKTDCGARLISSSKTQQPSFRACRNKMEIKYISKAEINMICYIIRQINLQ